MHPSHLDRRGGGTLLEPAAAMSLQRTTSTHQPVAIVLRTTKVARQDQRVNDVTFRTAAAATLRNLTPRQIDVLQLVLAGRASKTIAFKLGLSQRTIDHHRMEIGKRFGAKSFAEMVHFAVCAQCAIADPAVPSRCPTCADDPAHVLRRQTLDRAASVAADHASAMLVTMHETQHRMKNMAAVMVAMCHQTARQTASKKEFDKCFGDRVAAYCQSLDLMIASDWCNLGLRDLVELQLRPFGGDTTGQMSISGPQIELPPVALQKIGLALHELATNAIKFGALSSPAGTVRISWSIQPTERGENIVLVWKEAGGPATAPTGHHGFGSTLTNKLVASALNGTASHAFLPEGLEWTLAFQVP